jgi:hypothetical protein
MPAERDAGHSREVEVQSCRPLHWTHAARQIGFAPTRYGQTGEAPVGSMFVQPHWPETDEFVVDSGTPPAMVVSIGNRAGTSSSAGKAE